MNGKDKRHRRHFRRNQPPFGQDSQDVKNREESRLQNRSDKPVRHINTRERLRWAAPELNTDPLPVLSCSRCGQSITDLHAAMADKKNGEPVHFDCVMTELAEQETLEAGEVLSYIGGGRFGIVHFGSGRGEGGVFSIKKIFEWEDKEKQTEWRGIIADHYSVT